MISVPQTLESLFPDTVSPYAPSHADDLGCNQLSFHKVLGTGLRLMDAPSLEVVKTRLHGARGKLI